VGAIAESLQTHGQYRPIVVQSSTGLILAGNHTYRAAVLLGWDQIAVTYVDVDDDTATRILLVDNRTNDLATYDESALAALLEELTNTPLGLAGSGFDGDDLDRLIADLNEPAISPDERYTPTWVFDAMDVEFDVDLAAPPGGIPYIPAKAHFSEEDDALAHDWSGLFAWCNPPYSIASTFGRKWLQEISDGVWLGPQSHSTQYRIGLQDRSRCIWIPNEMQFTYGDSLEGIAFPVFFAGFGDRGEQAIVNLDRNTEGAGLLFKRWHVNGAT
jgi:hypothetical protein